MAIHSPQPPAFNVPGPIKIFAGLIVAIHIVRNLLPQALDIELLLAFAFIPARYSAEVAERFAFPGGFLADIWTFGTYALIHGDVMHLIINAFWLLAFGSPLAWRFGAKRFFLFSLVCAVAGAVLHLVTHVGEFVPVVGASAAISGHMAAVTRFMFQAGGPFSGRRDPGAFRVPALPLVEALKNPQVLVFLGFWLFINLWFGVSDLGIAGAQGAIAWQAHLGGFFAGLVLFRFFDPVPPGNDRPPIRLAA